MLSLGAVLAATGGRLVGNAAGELTFTKVVVDSRAVVPGALFVALRGERVDGHAFVGQAFAAGARAAIVERPTSETPCIVVESSAAALADMARAALRSRPDLEVVGITGSLGK